MKQRTGSLFDCLQDQSVSAPSQVLTQGWMPSTMPRRGLSQIFTFGCWSMRWTTYQQRLMKAPCGNRGFLNKTLYSFTCHLVGAAVTVRHLWAEQLLPCASALRSRYEMGWHGSCVFNVDIFQLSSNFCCFFQLFVNVFQLFFNFFELSFTSFSF